MSSPFLPSATRVILPDHPPEDPTLSRIGGEYQSHHRTLGLSLSYETNDRRVLQAVRDSFGPVIEAEARPDVHVRLFVHHVDEEPGWRPAQPLVRRHGDLFSISASRASTIAGHIGAGEAMGFISDTVASHPDFLAACFVQSAFLTFAQARSLVAVHAACLVRNGKSVLIRGLSGAGKSTLAYAALQYGFSLVAEDVVFLRRTRGTGSLHANEIEVHGMPWRMHMMPDARLLFPELRDHEPFLRANGEMKIGVRVEDRFPGQVTPIAPLGPHVFLGRQRGVTPYLRQLERDEALRLLRQTAIMDEPRVAEELDLWDAILEHPAWLLINGDDPDENAGLLGEVLEESWSLA